MLLKNGLIVDGAGKKGAIGDLLIKDGRIEEVSEAPIEVECPALDCTGKVVAPGFIDAHSHMDWFLPLPAHQELKAPFTAQGCTTFVAGNCGYGVAGFRRSSAYTGQLHSGLFPIFEKPWDTMEEYGAYLRDLGLSHNLATFAGHGMTRASIRGLDPSPLSDDETKELLALLDEAMDQGALGVSLGLQYAPGLFAPMDEIRRVAQLVQRKGKVLAVHGRAYSSLSAEYPLDLEGPPHNLLALEEMIGVARETGVRLQYSHLIFVGTKTHETFERCLAAIDKALSEGIDVQFDSYPYHCGNSVLNVILPTWFRENVPHNYHNPEALEALEAQFEAFASLVGLGFDDIQITFAGHPDLRRYDGMFLSEIAQERGVRPFDAFIEFAKRGAERDSRVLIHRYSTIEIIDALMRHPACLFMTDAVPGRENLNPATYGAFPRFLQLARDRNTISLEEAVRKMTGATADRFHLKDRGYLRKGMAADITVFDWRAIADTSTPAHPDGAPTGINAVFMNGRQVLRDGKTNGDADSGRLILT